MLVFKIMRDAEWRAFAASGETAGAPVDLADGFIHLSAGHQLPETARRHFAGEDGLWLIAVEADGLGEALRWEPSRGGELFPHLYRPLRRADVLAACPLPLEPDGHRFPEGLVG
jgi:uncharacterized protein (DUF952 family)